MEEKKTETSDTEAGLMSWIKEHRILLAVGLTVAFIVIAALMQNGNSSSTSSPTTNTSAKTEEVDASAKKIWLESSIERAESKNLDSLELDSQTDLQEALKEAKAVFNDENATQADVDTAKSKLDYVLDELKYKSADKDEVNKTITTDNSDEASVPVEYLNALKKAQSYNSMIPMSKKGLYEQLSSEYGEKFSKEAAQYAVDNLNADWKSNALAKAKSYEEQLSMSPAAIYDQLVSEYGEQFTSDEAQYAIDHLHD